MWQVGPFSSVFARGTHLGHFGARATRFGALGGLLGLVGTTLSSSLYILPLPLPFCKLELSMTIGCPRLCHLAGSSCRQAINGKNPKKA